MDEAKAARERGGNSHLRLETRASYNPKEEGLSKGVMVMLWRSCTRGAKGFFCVILCVNIQLKKMTDERCRVVGVHAGLFPIGSEGLSPDCSRGNEGHRRSASACPCRVLEGTHPS